MLIGTFLVDFKKIKNHYPTKDANNWIHDLFSTCIAQNMLTYIKKIILTSEHTHTEACYQFLFSVKKQRQYTQDANSS